MPDARPGTRRPDDQDLPQAWTVSATQFDLSRKTMSFLGPVPDDPSLSQGVIYATITCFEEGAAESVTRSAQAATDAGQSVIDRNDLGDGGFSAADDSGAIFLQLRHGKIVVYLAASGEASATDVDQLASAFDRALGGDGGAITPPTAVPSDDLGAVDSLDPGASDAAESPAAPALLARLPDAVGDVTLASDSASGSTILGEDQGSRAILAALRAAGREPDDLQGRPGLRRLRQLRPLDPGRDRRRDADREDEGARAQRLAERARAPGSRPARPRSAARSGRSSTTATRAPRTTSAWTATT